MQGLREREFNSLKILHHFDRLRALAEGRDIAPVTVEIDPVAYCNHACDWCVDPAHHKIRLNNETYQRLIAELAEFAIDGRRVEGIVFKGGGEPTLHPNFAAMVTQASDLGFAVGVVTNGSRLRRWVEPLANCAAYVRVSVDGPTPESHRRIHHSKDFNGIVEGVKKLVAARGGRRYPVIGLTFAMDIHTVALAADAVRLGEALAVDYVLLRPPFFEEVGHASTMTVVQAQQVRAELRRVAVDYAGPLEIMIGGWVGDVEQGARHQQTVQASGRRDAQLALAVPIEHRTGRCFASPLLAVVTADGTLYGCCNLRGLAPWAMGRLDYSLGVGFAALWEGAQRRDVLERMHRTACIRHCTHPLARYNEIIEVLGNVERPHSQFV